MRDPNRIPIILKQLEEYWSKHPYLRFFQLIELIRVTYNPNQDDMFYVEDDEIEIVIKGLNDGKH